MLFNAMTKPLQSLQKLFLISPLLITPFYNLEGFSEGNSMYPCKSQSGIVPSSNATLWQLEQV
jgi:hypothetical protein